MPWNLCTGGELTQCNAVIWRFLCQFKMRVRKVLIFQTASSLHYACAFLTLHTACLAKPLAVYATSSCVRTMCTQLPMSLLRPCINIQPGGSERFEYLWSHLALKMHLHAHPQLFRSSFSFMHYMQTNTDIRHKLREYYNSCFL